MQTETLHCGSTGRHGTHHYGREGTPYRCPGGAATLERERFWCETCDRRHPLIEHRACRKGGR